MTRPTSPFLHPRFFRFGIAGLGLLSARISSSALATEPPPTLPTAYWLGQTNNVWGQQNWATTLSGTPTTFKPGSGTDVIFAATGAANLNTTLSADLTIKSLTINAIVSISSVPDPTITVLNDTHVDNGSLTINAGIVIADASGFVGSNVGQTGSVTVTGTGPNGQTPAT